ncbi:MAG: epoxyqueuosine reductase [Desulfomonilia bacterium]
MDMKDLIGQQLKQAVAGYISSGPVQSAWKDPLIGFANAEDPLFKHLKRFAHPGHLLPADLLKGAKSVIVYFLPYTEAIVSSNVHGESPSRQWAYAYSQTNGLIAIIHSELTTLLESKGYRACTIPPTHNFDPVSLMSAWSHRHAAYIAGLGTFGLNRLLITENGCCGRIGSLVTDLELTPDKAINGNHCLYFQNGSCAVCLERCPCDALQKDTFDRRKCYERLLENESHLNLEGRSDVCGKCSCGLPCSLQNPVIP